MVDVTSIKQLREITGAGMMDCKAALKETNNDLEEAKVWLRKKGLAAAGKKSSRIASEGLVAIAKSASGNAAAVVEVNSETDFVAKNDKFKDLSTNIANIILENKATDIEQIKNTKYVDGNTTIADAIVEAIGVIGENINLRRSDFLELSSAGVVSTYLHNAVADNLGKIGVLVALESDADKEKLDTLGKQIAMHIAATRPEAITSDQVSTEALDKEKQIFTEQARAAGKPDNIIEKMVEGRIRKYYEEVVLMDQAFVIDSKLKVSEYLAQFAKENGTSVKVVNFTRFTLGEGVEKKEEDFASEVAKVAGS